MIFNKKNIILILIFFSLINFSHSKIDLKIVMKINNKIITTFDLEQEGNYLLALNPKLEDLNKIDLLELAKRSMIKETVRKSEINKYKDLNLQNTQINSVLTNITQNLGF